MMRKLVCLLLCLSLLMPVFSVSAEQETQAAQPETVPAATEETQPQTTEETQPDDRALRNLQDQLRSETRTEDQRIRQQIMRIHSISLQRTGHSTLGGRCGLQVSWELYLLGINKYLMTYHGKDHYDTYSAQETTTGGYTARAYDAQDYSLVEALNTISKNGTQDVYNIMVGFEKTNTEAGQLYGHVCMIHAILDGMVYFVEGFTTSFGTAEGEPIVVTIEQFANYFAPWTQYEGLVYFGTGDPLDSYTYYPCDLFAQCAGQQDILTVPDAQDGDLLRTVFAGERLHVTGLYEDMGGTYYYQVEDDGDTGYVRADKFQSVLFNYEDVTYTDPVLPTALAEGEKFQTGGKIATKNTQLGAVRVIVTDSDGESAMEFEILKDGNLCDMDNQQVRRNVDLSYLPAGAYVYSVYADALNNYLLDGKVVTENNNICLASAAFTVGQAELPEAAAAAAQAQQPVEGWNYIGGKWYFYENGTPRTGWFCHENHDYYMDETGAAVTGWALINGQMRYFGETGAMRTGWLRSAQGISYMLRNGVAATGWRTVDGVKYCFDENGKMLCGGWTEMENGLFYFHADGKAATGWVTLDSGTYSFHADGNLLAKREEDGDQMRIVNYDGTWKPYEADPFEAE